MNQTAPRFANGDLDALIRRQKTGYSLEQPFYRDAEIFERDMERIFNKLWLLVDHESRIPAAGDYFLFDVAGESIIILRGGDGAVRAFYNVCRHRGSRVCLEREGRKRLLVCPYHAWSYNLDGSLKSARLMPEDFDPAGHGLHPCHLRVLDGLIFVCLAEGDPPDFDEEAAPLLPYLRQHDFTKAKVAHRESYPASANWKLVVENFFECYHCIPSHPEYCTVHSRNKTLAYGAGPGSGPPGSEEAFQAELDAWNEKAEALGHLTGYWVDPDSKARLRSAERMPIKEGSLSETEDGRPAAPLMSNFKDFDGGCTSLSFNAVSTILAPNDHATLFRFTPRGPTETDMEIIWLVEADAEEGAYDVEKITWMWHVTTLEDKTIIENNHAGVMSRMYRPGPYSTQEAATVRFVEWYLNQIG